MEFTGLRASKTAGKGSSRTAIGGVWSGSLRAGEFAENEERVVDDAEDVRGGAGVVVNRLVAA